MADTRDTSGAGSITPEVDGILVRVLDGELSGTSEEEAQAILDSSLEARLRLEELWIDSDLLSEELADLPIPPTPEPTFLFRAGVAGKVPEAEPSGASKRSAVREDQSPDSKGRRSFTFPSMTLRHRIAAGIVLVLLSLALITPVRAWIVVGVRSLISVLAPAVNPADAPGGSEEGSSAVSFVPTGSVFTVTVEEHQSSGRLTVVVVEGSRASAEVSEVDSRIDLLVLPAGIEVRNEPGSVAGYTVEVPRSMARLRIRVGGRELGTHSLESVEIGHTWVFELANPRDF